MRKDNIRIFFEIYKNMFGIYFNNLNNRINYINEIDWKGITLIYVLHITFLSVFAKLITLIILFNLGDKLLIQELIVLFPIVGINILIEILGLFIGIFISFASLKLFNGNGTFSDTYKMAVTLTIFPLVLIYIGKVIFSWNL